MDLRPCRKIGNCSCGMAQFLLWHRSKQPPRISTHPGQVIFLDSSKSPGDIRSSETPLDARAARVTNLIARDPRVERSLDAARRSAYATPMPVYLSEQCCP